MNYKDGKLVDFFILIIISFCSLVVYSNTFYVPFQFDDIPCIKGNHSIMHIERIGEIFQFWPTRFITYFSFALNYKIHGFNVVGFHIFNILIHTGCSLLVWLLVRQILADNGECNNYENSFVSAFAGLIFALHPVQTQAVTYIYQRHTCLATLFILSALFFFIKAIADIRKNRFWFIISFILTAAAMFTKEISVVVPFLIATYFFLFKENAAVEISSNRVISYAGLLFILFLSIVFLTNSIKFSEVKQVHSMTGSPEQIITQKDYFLTQGQAFLIYFRLMLLPLNQNIDYDVPVSESIFSPPETFFGFILMAISFVFCLSMLKTDKIVSFFIAFSIISILPQSSIIPKPDLVVEHRLYLPLTGFAALVPYISYRLNKGRKTLITIFLCALIIFYGFLTYQRNSIWRDPFLLWNDAVTKSSGKARPYLNRGLAYANRNDIRNAFVDYTTAIKINPWYVEAYNNRGIILASMGKFQDALKDFDMAIKLQPNYAIAYNNRGVLFSSMDKWEPAFNDFNTALKLKPSYVDALKNRGIAFLIQGNTESALKDFSKAIAIDPRNGELYNYRAITFLMRKEKKSAENDARLAVKLGYSVNPALKSLVDSSGKH